jgi:hypothetical protein
LCSQTSELIQPNTDISILSDGIGSGTLTQSELDIRNANGALSAEISGNAVGTQLKEFDTGNHPWKEIDIEEDPTGKITGALPIAPFGGEAEMRGQVGPLRSRPI